MLPISTYGEMASKLRQKERGGTQAKTSSDRGREYMDIVDALKRERDLLKELIQYLEEEIDSVIIGVDTIDQLRQNIEIVRQGGLPPEVVEKINKLGTAPEYIIDPRQWPKSS